jgi:transcriptional regulator with XRE-family HTH domain
MTLGEAITAYQKAKNLNDADLARLWGVNQSTIHRIKAGERRVGNKVRMGCRLNTPDFYSTLLKYSEGTDG